MMNELNIILEGQIEKITYSNEETGYTVARLKVPEYHSPVTVVGNIISPCPGEILCVKGVWDNHSRFGRQFKVLSHSVKVPSTVDGIKKYLGSGFIKGIGPVMAARIVKRFKDKTLDIIENRTKMLAKIEGIGPKRIDMIRKAWREQKEIRDLMIFLQTHGVGSGHASKIFKQYGDESLSVLTRNPFKLATDIQGIGFNTADKIAEKLDFKKDNPQRIEAGILYVMNQVAEEGSVFYPYEPLVERCQEILEVGRDKVIRALAETALDKKTIIQDAQLTDDELESNNKAVYLARFHVSETGIAQYLISLISSLGSLKGIDTDKAIRWVEKKADLTLAPKQIEAVKRAVSSKAIVITGGPGTGKTTIINAVIKILIRTGAKIMLAAPTGRASKRMSEATGFQAKTIHRLLEFSMHKGGFQRDQDNPLETDVLILDEMSMVDNILMYHLLKAVPKQATLIMVGDIDQLPSVGPGNILGDIIRSGRIPVVELNKIFRQADESRIIINAHRINNGHMPELSQDRDILSDFYFIEQDNPEKVPDTIIELVSKRVPNRFGFDSVEDIQVLTPMHRGAAGTSNLNTRLQNELNQSSTSLKKGDRVFRLNDKVMQIRNNYEKDVFNGDIGRISNLAPDVREVTITYDGIPVPYDYNELDEIMLAYAISVHKSQGSEYSAVIVPILTQHYMLLQRNLIYTAVTRGKKLVILVGSKKALGIGIKNNRTEKRYTWLAERLKGN